MGKTLEKLTNGEPLDAADRLKVFGSTLLLTAGIGLAGKADLQASKQDELNTEISSPNDVRVGEEAIRVVQDLENHQQLLINPETGQIISQSPIEDK